MIVVTAPVISVAMAFAKTRTKPVPIVSEIVANVVEQNAVTVAVMRMSLVQRAPLIAANVRSILVVTESVTRRRRHAKIVKKTAASVVAPYAETVPAMGTNLVQRAPLIVVSVVGKMFVVMVAVIFPRRIASAVISTVATVRAISVPMASAISTRPVSYVPPIVAHVPVKMRTGMVFVAGPIIVRKSLIRGKRTLTKMVLGTFAK